MYAKRQSKLEWLKHSYVLLILACAFYPLLVVLIVSLKTNEQFEANPWFFDAIGDWHWENWAAAWGIVRQYIANSIVTTVTATVLGMGMMILSSYVLGRYRFPGRRLVYYAIIGMLFLPGTAAALVTLFDLLKNLGLVNSLWALILVGSASGQVIGIFILTQFIEELPRDLFETAQIDGAGHIQQIWHIVVPISGPIIGTVAILQFLETWNNVMLPLVILRDDAKLTIPVGLLRLEGEYIKQWGEMMAAYAIASAPLIVMFLFLMRLFVSGLAQQKLKADQSIRAR